MLYIGSSERDRNMLTIITLYLSGIRSKLKFANMSFFLSLAKR